VFDIKPPGAHRALDDLYGVLELLAKSHEKRTFLADLLSLDVNPQT